MGADLRVADGALRRREVHDDVLALVAEELHVQQRRGIVRAEDNALLCPCHQSTFDVLRGAVPTFGPAARRLPQLPMGVDDDGYLVALDDFPEPVGPSFWNVTHEVDA
jgi:ubiquinol-cytochrome c reductase iron-sulfur subunit